MARRHPCSLSSQQDGLTFTRKIALNLSLASRPTLSPFNISSGSCQLGCREIPHLLFATSRRLVSFTTGLMVSIMPQVCPHMA